MDAYFDFVLAYYGVDARQSNEQIAAQQVQALLADYLSRAYVDEYFSAKAKADVEEMIGEFIAIYKERILAQDWMSAETKAKAVKKLDTMGVKVGYPDSWESCLDRAEIKSPAEGGSFFSNVIAIQMAMELLAMAERNAREEVERVTTAAEREDKTLRSLAAMCGLSAAPKRMESYDISNTGASDIVASMVVYAGARPLKRDYRRFKMKSVTAHPDDYASMEEVLTRRLQRYADGDEKFAPLPDVFLIDGGMTHAAVAEKVCAAFGLHIPIFGMVKDDRHRTRALTTAEGHEIDLHADPAVFALIGQIQEETHRFAITYHHESHTRSSVASALDGIPNIGEVRKRKLLARFKSVKAIREAELPALQSELGRAAGRAVYDHFHPKEETP